MKTQLKAKLLQHLLRNKKNDKGFTLIELLVVIIIIGILAAIALPSFLNQASKARQAEAKQTLGAVVRGQQAYRLENPTFADEIAKLALGVKSQTKNYNYVDALGGNPGKFSEDGKTFGKYAEIFGDALDEDAVKDYAAAAAASQDESGNATTITQICEANKPIGQTGAKAAETTYDDSATPPEIDCDEANGNIPL
ncbi:MAG: type IV pilin-like G/H family protein [Leptolyngbyaceae cyanobacterium MO_188.B28]|nr:type IV pilin-like G/H family protein [Leptolyngbyaceae cyanobacterium MO_188.B28]